MKLWRISIGNLRRRKSKSLLLVAGLAIGIATVVALTGITRQMKADVEKKLDEFGANIIVTPRSENLSLSYGGVGVADASYDIEELREEDAALITTIENKGNISAVAPKVLGAKKLEGRDYLIVGVDFPSELKIKKWWRLKGNGHMHGNEADKNPLSSLPKVSSPDEVLIGSSASEALGLGMGGTLSIEGRDYRVAGVLEENASQDDMAIFMDIKEARIALGKKGLSMIEVSALCSACPIEDIVAQIGGKLPHAKVSAVRQAMSLKMQTVEQIISFSAAVSVVVLLIGSLIVFVSMTSSVNERTKEIGVLRAIGFRKSHIMKVILTEAVIVSLIAGLSGWLLGSLSVLALAPKVMGIGALTLAAFDPFLAGLATAIALTLGLASSIYPALKASRLEPLEAMRYI